MQQSQTGLRVSHDDESDASEGAEDVCIVIDVILRLPGGVIAEA
jgi:hypothetical protein